MNPINKIRSSILGIAGYLIPLIQSLPAVGVWTGLMTLPFASYLILFLANFPTSLFNVSEFFLWSYPLLIPEKTLIVIGLFFLFYSMIYLKIKGNDGLVTSGPYRIIRHPQYLSIILTTLGLTSLSVWILKNTRGIGFLNPMQTISVWFIQLFAYFILAIIEEQFLSRKYGEIYNNYKNQVPFLIPFLKTSKKSLNFLISGLIPSSVLFLLVSIH